MYQISPAQSFKNISIVMTRKINFPESHADPDQTIQPQSVSLHAELAAWLMEYGYCTFARLTSPDRRRRNRLKQIECSETASPLTTVQQLYVVLAKNLKNSLLSWNLT